MVRDTAVNARGTAAAYDCGEPALPCENLIRVKRLVLAVAAVALLALPAAVWAAGFDAPGSNDSSQQLDTLPVGPYTNVQRDDTPTDPDYDRAEPDDPTPGVTPSTNLFDERFDLFGFASALTRASARYTAGPHAGSGQVSGFNAAGAWKVTRGLPSVKVAILDTGINFDNAGLRNKVALNRGELPKPEGCTDYDCNSDGAFNVLDYASDSRVHNADGDDNADSVLDPSDLIHDFSDSSDADGNGYVDDIAGWDFFNDDNDPQDTSSYFAAENHGSGRTEEAVEQGNDAAGSIGVCPKCQVVPLRVWDTFVSDQNDFFTAVTYATDNGVKVIEGADGGLYHSSFAEKASQYAYDHGVSQVFSGDDLNTANHNYPGAYNHTMLIQGTVPDTVGLGMDLPSQNGDPGFHDALLTILQGLNAGTELPVGTYFRGANTTQFGGHSSISMEGPTGSTNTGKAAGAAALVVAAAKAHGVDLNADETRGLLEQTAEDVLPQNTAGTGTPDPAQAGFDTHFGYGRADVGAAVHAADTGNIPPTASIGSPDWYAPLTGSSAGITGRASARGDAFHWTLEYGAGLAPTSWTTVREGDSSGAAVTNFGSIDLNAVRAALAGSHADCLDPAGPTLTCTNAEDPFQGQFTVRVTVHTDGVSLDGVDRKVLTAVDSSQQDLRGGFPKRLGAGGEAPIRYSDLNGDNVQELVVPTEDGTVHAYEPDGSELAGWPVHTQEQAVTTDHHSSPAFGTLSPPREPPRAATIADLDGDGRPEIVTAAGERIYAWDYRGHALPGWPVRPIPSANCSTAEQQKGLKHPKCGFLATPAVGRLEGPTKPLDVVEPGLDGRLYAFRPDHTALPGFPVRLQDTSEAEPMTAESINDPAIGDLDGDHKDDVVVATNEEYGGSSGGGDVGFGGLLAAAGSTSRVYGVKSSGSFLPGWPVQLGGVIQDVLPFIGPGHDAALVKVGGDQKIVTSTTGSTSMTVFNADGSQDKEIDQVAGGVGALNLFESAAVGDLDGSGPGGVAAIKYQLDLAAAANLLLVGQNAAYSHRIGAYDISSGTPKFPAIQTDDYQFLSSSTVARVASGASNQIVAGTGLGLLHAYDGSSGLDVAGFPKVTGGWLFAPAALSDDKRMAGVTREGYLFEWQAPGAASCQSEWPSFRHDQRTTGNYDADGTPPAAPDHLALTALGGNRYRLGFRSPGDDGFCGTANRYLASVNGQALDLGSPAAGGSTLTHDLTLPAGTARIVIRAADGPAGSDFNLGPPATMVRSAGGGVITRPKSPAPRPCLPRRLTVSAARIGPARLRHSLKRLEKRYRVAHRSRRGVRFCVRGGGRFLVSASKGRIAVVATTARRHRTRRRGPGTRVRHGRIKGTRSIGHGILLGHKTRSGRVVYGVKKRRIRYLAVATRRQSAHRRTLIRALRRLGLR